MLVYMYIFLSLSVKAVHLGFVYSLKTEAFLTAFLLIIAQRGNPSTVWSESGSNFVDEVRHLKSSLHF